MVDVFVPKTSHSMIQLPFFIVRNRLPIFLFKKSQNAVFLIRVIISGVIIIIEAVVSVHHLYYGDLTIVSMFSDPVLDVWIVLALKEFKFSRRSW